MSGIGRSGWIDRRNLLTAAAFGCGMTAASALARPYGAIIEQTPFARLERLAEGVWAVVSTPLNHDDQIDPGATGTFCNGGLIVGRERIIAIDGFFRPDGAAWLSDVARKLTGKDITDVIVTHFHADHTGGLAGYQHGAEGPAIIATEMTRKLIIERYSVPIETPDSQFMTPAIRPVLPTHIISDGSADVVIDLGGRTLRLELLNGHTPSDVAIWIEDEGVVFAGDLVWAGLFHNYMDAIPSRLRSSAARILSDKNHIVVPGHGYVAKARDLHNYLDLLDNVEEAARTAIKKDTDIASAATKYKPPKNLGEWRLFAPDYYEKAFRAWERELTA